MNKLVATLFAGVFTLTLGAQHLLQIRLNLWTLQKKWKKK